MLSSEIDDESVIFPEDGLPTLHSVSALLDRKRV